MANDQGRGPVGRSGKEPAWPAPVIQRLAMGCKLRCCKRRPDRRLCGAAARAANGLQVRLLPACAAQALHQLLGASANADRQPACLPASRLPPPSAAACSPNACRHGPGRLAVLASQLHSLTGRPSAAHPLDPTWCGHWWQAVAKLAWQRYSPCKVPST